MIGQTKTYLIAGVFTSVLICLLLLQLQKVQLQRYGTLYCLQKIFFTTMLQESMAKRKSSTPGSKLHDGNENETPLLDAKVTKPDEDNQNCNSHSRKKLDSLNLAESALPLDGNISHDGSNGNNNNDNSDGICGEQQESTVRTYAEDFLHFMENEPGCTIDGGLNREGNYCHSFEGNVKINNSKVSFKLCVYRKKKLAFSSLVIQKDLPSSKEPYAVQLRSRLKARVWHHNNIL